MKPVIIVHGGAWDMPQELWAGHLQGVRRAAKLGHDLMEKGGSALDAVEAAILSMEDDPIFNAGCGSVFNEDGEVHLDAGLMWGADLGFGGLTGVKRLANPISVARALLEKDSGKTVLLAGDGAERFAQEMGFPFIENDHLHCEREVKEFKRLKALAQAVQSEEPRQGDTVGAVALDSNGHIAAGNSTGGTPLKRYGRVGDSPLPGCGLLADDEVGGICCTGWGESIIRTTLAARIMASFAAGHPPQDALKAGMEIFEKRVNGHGGAILLTKEGDIAQIYNTTHMAWAAVTREGELLSGGGS